MSEITEGSTEFPEWKGEGLSDHRITSWLVSRLPPPTIIKDAILYHPAELLIPFEMLTLHKLTYFKSAIVDGDMGCVRIPLLRKSKAFV